jgi:hypothetical protein
MFFAFFPGFFLSTHYVVMAGLVPAIHVFFE